jgi:hypothetical protein
MIGMSNLYRITYRDLHGKSRTETISGIRMKQLQTKTGLVVCIYGGGKQTTFAHVEKVEEL